MSFETWITFLAAASANVLSPGPAIALAIRNGMTLGTGPSVYSTLGNVTAIGIVGLMVSTGLGLLISAHPEILDGLRILGGGYLIWLGFKSWDGGLLSEKSDPQLNISRPIGYRLFLQSMLVGLTNPKMLLFLLALFPIFLDLNKPVSEQLALMTGTFMVLSFLSLTSFALAANQFSKIIHNPQTVRNINRVMALILCCFGAVLIYAGM